MTPEQRAREYVTIAFGDLGVPSLEPYIQNIAELIAGAENDVLEEAAQAMTTQTQGQSPADNEVAKLRAEVAELRADNDRLNRALDRALKRLNWANDPTWDREKL